jgi:hypothetical protein
LIVYFKFLKRVKNSLLLHTTIPLISSFFGRWLVLNPFFLFAGTLSFDEKIHQSGAQAVILARLGDTEPSSRKY